MIKVYYYRKDYHDSLAHKMEHSDVVEFETEMDYKDWVKDRHPDIVIWKVEREE